MYYTLYEDIGVTLKEAKILFDAMSGGTFDADFKKNFASTKLQEIDEKITKLQKFKEKILSMGTKENVKKNAKLVERMK